MKRNTKWFAAVIVAALVAITGESFLAQQTNSQSVKDEVALRAAMERETVQGDLKGAIEQYKKIAESKDRSIAVRALVQMAGAYQKLGDAEARKVYQRIVRDYADQKDAVSLAQARLGSAPAVASAKGYQMVWNGSNIADSDRVSPDGRFITSTGLATRGSRLTVHDVAANTDRELTRPTSTPEWAASAAISRDGKQIIYEWWDEKPPAFAGIRIAELHESGFLEPREFFRPDYGVYNIDGLDWSPDRKWVAVAIRRKNKPAQLGLIAVADGSFRVLKSIDWNGSETRRVARIFFSPDSRYIAYDLPATVVSPQRDVFVLPIDGGREISAVVHGADDAVMGWSPDGTRLLFSSDRTGSVDLWALPFANGQAQGAPELLKSSIGPSSSLGVTAAGALYVYKRVSTRDITVAPIDLEAGKLVRPPVSFTQGFVEGPKNSNWSPDGKFLAYPACYNRCIVIRTVATGEVRQLPLTLNLAYVPFWSADGRSLLIVGGDPELSERRGIYQVDTQSGEAKAVVLGDGIGGDLRYSRDGKKLYFYRNSEFVERDLASGAERIVYTDTGAVGALSPDGQYFAVMHRDPSPNTVSLLLVPVAGGPPREFLRLTSPEGFGWRSPVWTPDGSAVIFDKNTGSRRELWLAPVTGGPPRKLDIDPDIWLKGAGGGGEQGFSLSPDGRSIAFQMGITSYEVWALENFLPAPNTKK